MSFRGKVLLIDDDESLRTACLHTLDQNGFSAAAVESGEQALQKVRQESFDVALLDLKIQGMSAMEALKRLRQESPNTAVVVMARRASFESALRAGRLGAFDYLPKPFSSEALLTTASKAAHSARTALEDVCIGQELDRKMPPQALIGGSEAMNRVLRLIRKAAPVDSTALIAGETGVGKEVVARTIHRLSHRANRSFVLIDCNSLSESLFESELFGHVKGSLPGAGENVAGKIERADGGTLFFDEIASLPAPIQARLLRTVQEREVSRIGSPSRKKINVRILASTSHDLRKCVREGGFRDDLYYRLNVIPVPVPPLRERPEDIPALTDYYLKKLAFEKGKNPLKISDEAISFLMRLAWPGNVRELINALEYAVVTCEGKTLQVRDLPYEATESPGDGEKTRGSLARAQQNEIIQALEQFRGNKSRAAEHLGINRKTLREKMQKYGLAKQKNRE